MIRNKVIANVTLAEGEGMQPSMIISGANNDVFVGGSKTLTRIHV